MNLEKDILELENMLFQFEEAFKEGWPVRMWVDKGRIEALKSALEAMKQVQNRSDDLK